MPNGFADLSAVFLNCSLERDPARSHTRRLIERAAGVMRSEGVSVEVLHLLEHEIPAGMHKDLTELGVERDDWPAIQRTILDADILVIGTPIWLGVKSSVATLAIERLYAYSGDRNEQGQYVYYGRTAGCVVTGNEDGAKGVAMEVLYALQHIGYVVPPQADCAWLGEAGPGPSYGDVVDGEDLPTGYGNDFTNRNTTIMAWNLMHAAKLLRDAGGFPALGNQPDRWRDVANATQTDPG
ncbi:MAG: flavodoxin family protein [Acidimicrobiales bacterium]|nr:flavodoxin family protein [Acidimicrobiales bacterium]